MVGHFQSPPRKREHNENMDVKQIYIHGFGFPYLVSFKW